MEARLFKSVPRRLSRLADAERKKCEAQCHAKDVLASKSCRAIDKLVQRAANAFVSARIPVKDRFGSGRDIG
jgi:hypothetical protein